MKYNLHNKVLSEYQHYVSSHICYVQKVCELLGVPKEQSDKHDASKYDPQEFVPYAMHFYSDEDWRKQFNVALTRHVHLNPHHWQQWLQTGMVHLTQMVRAGIYPSGCWRMVPKWS